MKKEELMPGNWVYSSRLMSNNSNGELFYIPFRVKFLSETACIDLDSVDIEISPGNYWFPYKSLIPIRITVENLEKIGFTVENSKNESITMVYESGDYEISCSFWKRNIEGLSVIDSKKYTMSFSTSHMKYMHELQNLLTINNIKINFDLK